MDEYISRKAAIAYIRERSEECQKAFEEFGGESGIYADAYNDLAEDFHSIPAADVAPVVHGKWIVRFDGPYNRRRCYCSHCGKHNGVGGIAQNQEKPYCPNCGAKMDGGDNNAAD